jgi:hypothetical protein
VKLWLDGSPPTARMSSPFKNENDADDKNCTGVQDDPPELMDATAAKVGRPESRSMRFSSTRAHAPAPACAPVPRQPAVLPAKLASGGAAQQRHAHTS